MERGVAALIDEVEKQLPTDATDSGTPFNVVVATRLRELYASPPVTAASMSAGRAVGANELRRALFVPDLAAGDAELLASLLLPLPPSMPEENPRRKLQAHAMVLVQLRHAESWPLLGALVACGALSSLAQTLAAPGSGPAGEFRRAQALDLLLRATSHPSFDWFRPAAEAGAALPASAPAAARRRASDAASLLHRCMLALAPPGPLVPALLALAPSPAPGLASSAARLLAFWLSWARRLHARDGALRLAPAVLDALRRWGGLPDDAKPPPLDEGKAEPAGGGSADEGEDAKAAAPGPGAAGAPASPGGEDDGGRAMARVLWLDFARFGPAGDAAASGLPEAAEGAGDGGRDSDGEASEADAGRLAEAADLKAEGNASYARRRDLRAAAMYAAAAEGAERAGAAASRAAARLRCDALSNRAAALLRAGEAGGCAGDAADTGPLEGAAAEAVAALPGASDWRGLLAAAEEAAGAVLAAAPGHAKALWRRSRARRGLGERAALEGAADDARALLSVLSGKAAGDGACAVSPLARACNASASLSARKARALEARALLRLVEAELSDMDAAAEAGALEGLEARVFRAMAPPGLLPEPAVPRTAAAGAEPRKASSGPGGAGGGMREVGDAASGVADILAAAGAGPASRSVDAASIASGSVRVDAVSVASSGRPGRKSRRRKGGRPGESQLAAMLRPAPTGLEDLDA